MPSVESNEASEPWATAVLLHPHPDMGGDRFNIVVDSLYRGLPPAGVSTVRFDFSSSDMEVGRAETLAAVAPVAIRPRFIVGYSFGAMVATSVVDDVVDGWFLIAPPLSWVPSQRLEALGRDQRPKAVAVAEHDQYAPLSQLAPLTEGWINTTTTVITGTDHFMAGATTKVLDQVLAWLRAVAGPGQA